MKTSPGPSSRLPSQKTNISVPLCSPPGGPAPCAPLPPWWRPRRLFCSWVFFQSDGQGCHFALCPLILLLFFVAEPGAVRRQAGRDYQTYAALLCPATLRIFPDNVVTVAPHLTLTDQYALMPECIETPELLVFLKDRERFLVLPKRCMPEEQREALLEQFRITFVRRRRRMSNWLF